MPPWLAAVQEHLAAIDAKIQVYADRVEADSGPRRRTA
jgi:hypothetical protein